MTRDILNVTRHLTKRKKNTSSSMSSILNVFFYFFYLSLKVWLCFCPRFCSRWNVLKVVCKIGKFTIRDAILFHKFCIFNKEYFVFLAHHMFVCKSFFGGCVFVCFPAGLTCCIQGWIVTVGSVFCIRFQVNTWVCGAQTSLLSYCFFFHISREKCTRHSGNNLTKQVIRFSYFNLCL